MWCWSLSSFNRSRAMKVAVISLWQAAYMSCYDDAAKGAFDTLYSLGIWQNHFLGDSENFCSRLISSRRGDRTDNTKCSFSSHFSEELGEREQSEVSRGSGSAVPSSQEVHRCQFCSLSSALF